MNDIVKRMSKFGMDGGSLENRPGRLIFSYSGSPAAIAKIRMKDGEITYFFNDVEIGQDLNELKSVVLDKLGY